MLKWKKTVYCGNNIKTRKKIMHQLNAGKNITGIYLLTMPTNPHNMMDILPAALLVQENFGENLPPIFGLATSKSEATGLAVDIITRMYQTTGGFDLDAFLD